MGKNVYDEMVIENLKKMEKVGNKRHFT